MIIRKMQVAAAITALVIIIPVTLFSGKLSAVQKSEPGATAQQPSPLPASLNLHYTGEYCDQCHEGIPQKGGPALLKHDGDFKKLCGSCHDNALGSYLHPVDIVPSDEKKAKIPTEFPLRNGEVTCSTCHDLFLQCQKSSAKLSSVRGAPYPKRGDFCFRCHEEKNYPMLNPHNQLDPNGVILAEQCLNCHVEKPDEKKAEFEDVQLIGTVNDVCRKCHVISGNHSGNYNHFVKPKPKTLAVMQANANKFGIILPLDENGKLTCVTCHNPHQKGVIPPNRPGAKGADSKFRHRLQGNMCKACHNF